MKKIKTFQNIRNWVRWVAAVATVAILLAQPQTAQTQADFSELLEIISPPVVQIETPAIGSGSGYIAQYTAADGEVNTGIVTACHVVVDAPRVFDEFDGSQTVFVTLGGWRPEITFRAAVVKCNAGLDTALLQPLNGDGEVTSLGSFFEALALEQSDPSLRGIPRLYFGDSDAVDPLDSVFIIGFPGPFTEMTTLLGRTNGSLPVPMIVSDAGRVDRSETLMIYQKTNDDEISLSDILQLQTMPAVDLERLAKLAQDIFDAGHGLVILSSVQPLINPLTAWDVVGFDEDGLLRVRERPVAISSSLLGASISFGPLSDHFGTISLLREFLRVDVPVVGGHSGAPVMNIAGQVIGMVEWRVSLEGAAFANPGNDVLQALLSD